MAGKVFKRVSAESLLYVQVADQLARRIDDGVYRAGDRMPGVRVLATQQEISIATAVAACRRLEDMGYLEARPRSGYYVRARTVSSLRDEAPLQVTTRPRLPGGQQVAMAMIKAAEDPNVMPLGAAVPDASFLPVEALSRALTRTMRQQRVRIASYMMPPGAPELRRQLARRIVEAGGKVAADEVVITTGCQEALSLALRAVTKPGDVVAVESPTFYGLLHVMESLGLKVLEIPTHPREGISLEALEAALVRWRAKACVAIPNYSNPQGYCMSEARKRALVALLARHEVTLIEDEVYGDLGFSSTRPASCLSLMPGADIIQCGSFSKTLSPGLRVGWVTGPHHHERIEYLKYVTSIATPTVPQLAVAALLESGRYERYLREVRPRYAAAVARMSEAVSQVFPAGTRLSQPQGGFVLWVELPEDIDTSVLAQRALQAGISIAPGEIFSANGNFRNFFRISCGRSWDARLANAIRTLAKLLA